LLRNGYAFKQSGTWVTNTSVKELPGTITVESAPVKLEMGGTTTFYADADEAWAAAKGKTATITLTGDAQANAALTVETGDNIDFNGGDYNLTGSGGLTVVRGGGLSITGGKLSVPLLVKGGTVLITGGTYSSIKVGDGIQYKDLLGEDHYCYR